MRSKARPANKAESARMLRVKTIGCLCCMAKGWPHDPDGPMVDAHHLIAGSRRVGHDATIGLCKWHHMGRLTIAGWTHKEHRLMLGPSLAEGSDPFHLAFGSDAELLETQNRLLGEH